MRALPARGGVGGVARVDQGHGGLDRGIVEVRVETAHLGCHQHAFVDDGTAGHGARIEDLSLKGGAGVGALLDGAATYIQGAFKVVARPHAVGPAQESLHDGGHAGLRGGTQVMRVDRYLAPEQQGHAACGAALLKDTLGIFYALGILRQKEHGDAVVAFLRQDLAAFLSLFTEEAMRNLEQDARAVTGVALQPDAASMLKVDKHRECIVQNLVAFVAIDVCQRTDAAGVVLKFRSPKRLHMGTSLRGVFGIRSVHRVLQSMSRFSIVRLNMLWAGFFHLFALLLPARFETLMQRILLSLPKCHPQETPWRCRGATGRSESCPTLPNGSAPRSSPKTS